ncbi:tryptophan 7-halogenase [Caulobacter segnis]
MLIEAAVAMIARLLPHSGPVSAPARRFNELMTARCDNIIVFLKLHYCLSQRPERFWRENTDPASIPERLVDLLEQWRHRPPARFDFILDLETFAFFNYQYILYGMGFRHRPDGRGRRVPGRGRRGQAVRQDPRLRRPRHPGPAQPPRPDRPDQPLRLRQGAGGLRGPLPRPPPKRASISTTVISL